MAINGTSSSNRCIYDTDCKKNYTDETTHVTYHIACVGMPGEPCDPDSCDSKLNLACATHFNTKTYEYEDKRACVYKDDCQKPSPDDPDRQMVCY